MGSYEGINSGRRRLLRLAATGLGLGVLPYSPLAGGAAPALRIGTVGSGRIGGTLGELWLKAGHEVMFSSVDLEHDRALAAKLGGKARAGTPREAAAFGEVLLIAVPYAALPKVGSDLGSLLKGKAVIDACNPIIGRDGEMAVKAREKGAGLASAEFLPGARIVRAFNAVGYARLPEIAQGKGERPGMPMAGDDKGAIEIASRLVREVGFEPVVIGPLEKGRHLIPGTALAGVQTPEQLRRAAATLN
jgi:predicted dinucleotide-binding enzyme